MEAKTIPVRVIPNADLILLNEGEWIALAQEHCERYKNADPFPHVVIDQLFPDAILDRIAEEVGRTEKDIRKRFYGAQKSGSYTPSRWGPYTRQFMTALNSAPFLAFLEALTGIDGLIPDPYYFGGGIHESQQGGFLKIHTDFNYYPALKLDRRLNLLLYLNRDWKSEYGGALELWSTDMKQRQVAIEPVFNRTVVFSTSDFSFHGHPEPMPCPTEVTRKSLALYYYSNGRPSHEVRVRHRVETNYQPRPGERLEQEGGSRGGQFRSYVKRLLPEPLLNVLRAAKQRRQPR